MPHRRSPPKKASRGDEGHGHKASELEAILTELIHLDGLDDHRRRCAAELQDALRTGSDDEIARLYCSREWWGGSGSMCDFIPQGRANYRAYEVLLIRLVDGFRASGFECSAAENHAVISRKWLEDGVI